MELFVITGVAILIVLITTGNRVGEAARAAVDDADTQAGKVAAASGGSCLLILMTVVALALLFAAAAATLPRLP